MFDLFADKQQLSVLSIDGLKLLARCVLVLSLLYIIEHQVRVLRAKCAYLTYTDRLATFSEWPLQSPTRFELARRGLYWLPTANEPLRLVCAFCNRRFTPWPSTSSLQTASHFCERPGASLILSDRPASGCARENGSFDRDYQTKSHGNCRRNLAFTALDVATQPTSFHQPEPENPSRSINSSQNQQTLDTVLVTPTCSISQVMTVASIAPGPDITGVIISQAAYDGIRAFHEFAGDVIF